MTARRTFLASAVALAASAAIAQPKPRRIAYLSNRSAAADFDRVFVTALRELGYVEGRDHVIDWRFAAGDVGRLDRLAGELVALHPDVIVASGPGGRFVARATSTIPIVAIVADPVGQGLARSLARPGGNVTGLTLQSSDLAAKRVQLLRELVPDLRRVGLLVVVTGVTDDPGRQDAAGALAVEMAAAARRANVELVTYQIRTGSELPAAFARFRRERAHALIVQTGPTTFDARQAIIALAEEARMPALYEIRNYVDDGGLLSYGPDLDAMYRRAANYVDRILRGAKPAEMAIEQPGKFELVVNLKAARALALAIPPAVQLRADHLIR